METLILAHRQRLWCAGLVALCTSAHGAGVRPKVEAAIGQGLRFLADKQDPDGSWRTSTGHLGLMAIATLAFMSNGHVPARGEYENVVTRAVDHILECQEPQTGLLNVAGWHYDMYNHGLTTLLLTQIYGMNGDGRVRSGLVKAVKLILKCQGAPGGWQYAASAGTHDSSISVMQLVALRAARSVGVAVPKEAVDRGIRYIRACYLPHQGTFDYWPRRGKPSYALTACGTTSLLAAGYTPAADDMVRGGLAYLMTQTPAVIPASYNYYFYGTYYAAMAAKAAGGRYYTGIYPRVVETLLASQLPDGSWSCRAGGPIMGTGIGVFVLSMDKELLPLYQEETQ